MVTNIRYRIFFSNIFASFGCYMVYKYYLFRTKRPVNPIFGVIAVLCGVPMAMGSTLPFIKSIVDRANLDELLTPSYLSFINKRLDLRIDMPNE